MSDPVSLNAASSDPQVPAGLAPVANNETYVGSSGVSLGHYFSLLAEDIVLNHMPYHVQDGSQGGPLLPKDMVNSWELTKAQLATLGYRPDREDPWAILGIQRMEGPTPTSDMIANRARCGKQIVQLCSGARAPNDDTATAQVFANKLQCAAHACLQSLSTVPRDRKHQPRPPMIGGGWLYALTL